MPSNRELMVQYKDAVDSAVKIHGYRSRDKWLKHRRKLVMASETPVLWGMSASLSPYSLFVEKTTGIEDETREARLEEVFYWGHKLEDLIAQRFQETHPTRNIADPGDYAIAVHKDFPFMGATVDRLQWAHLDGWGVLELKSRNTWAGGEWDSKVPDDVLLQLHHQMLCTGTAWGSVACLIGGNKFVWEDIQRNDAVCQKLVEKAREFNKRLQTGEAPPIDGSESTGHTLRLLHPDDNGNAVHLDASIRVWDELYVTSCEQEKAAQASKREAQNHLIAAIGDNTFGVGENFEWSYKTQERSISLKVEPEHEVALIKARIPYDITGGTKSRVLRRKSK